TGGGAGGVGGGGAGLASTGGCTAAGCGASFDHAIARATPAIDSTVATATTTGQRRRGFGGTSSVFSSVPNRGCGGAATSRGRCGWYTGNDGSEPRPQPWGGMATPTGPERVSTTWCGRL